MLRPDFHAAHRSRLPGEHHIDGATRRGVKRPPLRGSDPQQKDKGDARNAITITPRLTNQLTRGIPSVRYRGQLAKKRGTSKQGTTPEASAERSVSDRVYRKCAVLAPQRVAVTCPALPDASRSLRGLILVINARTTFVVGLRLRSRGIVGEVLSTDKRHDVGPQSQRTPTCSVA